MGHLERGEKNVSFNTLARLADALDISLSELVAEDGAQTRKKPPRGHSRLRLEDLNDIVRELTQRRISLEETGRVLKVVTEALRSREKKLQP